jgi:hypothetical protein
MKTISDETLMAYADGEVPLADRRALRKALAQDPSLAQRLESFLFTREPLARAYQDIMRAPVPEYLLQIVAGPDRTPRVGSLLLNLARLARITAGFRVPVRSLATVSVLMIGVAVGWLLHPNAVIHQDLVIVEDGGLIASPSLRYALEKTASGDEALVAGHPLLSLKLKFSFLTHRDQVCRLYELVHGTNWRSAGLACRADGGVWRLEVQTAAVAYANAAGKYVPASDGAGAIDSTIGNIIKGIPLGKEEEARLIANAWQSKP